MFIRKKRDAASYCVIIISITEGSHELSEEPDGEGKNEIVVKRARKKEIFSKRARNNSKEKRDHCKESKKVQRGYNWLRQCDGGYKPVSSPCIILPVHLPLHNHCSRK